MGEIADQIISGFLDQETLEVIDGDAPGYPRTRRQSRREKREPIAATKQKPYSCPDCGRCFASKQGRKDHRRDKHQRAVTLPGKEGHS